MYFPGFTKVFADAGRTKRFMKEARMFATKTLTLLLLLTVAGVIAGQEQKKPTVDSKGQPEFTPEMEERASKRREILGDPQSFAFVVKPKADRSSEVHGRPVTKYKAGSEISFELSATSMLTEPFEVPLLHSYDKFRPELYRDEQLVPYRKGTVGLLEKRENLWTYVSLRYAKLEPNKPQLIGSVNLGDWYDPLVPGTYTLTLKHRLDAGESWLELPPITFEIVP